MGKSLLLATAFLLSGPAIADELDDLRPLADACQRHRNGAEFAPGFEDCKALTEKFRSLAAQRAAKQDKDEADRIKKWQQK